MYAFVYFVHALMPFKKRQENTFPSLHNQMGWYVVTYTISLWWLGWALWLRLIKLFSKYCQWWHAAVSFIFTAISSMEYNTVSLVNPCGTCENIYIIIMPFDNWAGYTGFTLSVRLSILLSLCLQTKSCRLCIAHNTCQIHFIFRHLICQFQKVCCMLGF